MSITQSELLEALAAAAPGTGPETARTVQEMVEETGISVRRVRLALAALQRQGRLAVHRVTRRAMDGRAAIVPAYTVAAAPRTAKARR